jgi:hypothetical protein
MGIFSGGIVENEQIWPVKWGQERRLELIEFRLLWDGKVNRSDLTNFFGISVPQASLDLALYQQRAPKNTQYDKQQKAYIATPEFVPILVPENPLSYLNQVWQVEAGLAVKESTFLGWYPSANVVRPPSRTINPIVLRGILNALQNQQALEVVYQSMTRDTPSTRLIAPHTFVFDGRRWHIRSYCYEHKDFRDFVIDRITECKHTDIQRTNPDEDTAWNQVVTVILRPASRLSIAQKKAIADEYAMQDDRLQLPTRKALLLYLLKQLPIVTRDSSSKHSQLEIENRDEILSHIKALGLDFNL